MIKQNKMASMLLLIFLMASVSFSNSFCEVLSPIDTRLIVLDCLEKTKKDSVFADVERREKILKKCYDSKMELLKELVDKSKIEMDLETEQKMIKELDKNLNNIELNSSCDGWLLMVRKELYFYNSYIKSIENDIKEKNSSSETFNKILETCCTSVQEKFKKIN